MAKRIRIDDFADLALALKPTLGAHKVPLKYHHSLISDVVFQVAAFIDERTGSNFHESIDGLLEGRLDLSAPFKPSDYLVAELEFTFEKGRKVTNLLSSQLANPAALAFNLEMALGLRAIEEIDATIDVAKRFEALMKRRGGIRACRFNLAADLAKPRWQTLPAADYSSGLPAICAAITDAAKKWPQ